MLPLSFTSMSPTCFLPPLHRHASSFDQIPPKTLSDLLYKAALTLPEMSSVLCIFKLLDLDGDGLLKLEDLKKAQSIEKKVVEGVLEVRLQYLLASVPPSCDVFLITHIGCR